MMNSFHFGTKSKSNATFLQINNNKQFILYFLTGLIRVQSTSKFTNNLMPIFLSIIMGKISTSKFVEVPWFYNIKPV